MYFLVTWVFSLQFPEAVLSPLSDFGGSLFVTNALQMLQRLYFLFKELLMSSSNHEQRYLYQ